MNTMFDPEMIQAYKEINQQVDKFRQKEIDILKKEIEELKKKAARNRSVIDNNLNKLAKKQLKSSEKE